MTQELENELTNPVVDSGDDDTAPITPSSRTATTTPTRALIVTDNGQDMGQRHSTNITKDRDRGLSLSGN